VILQPVLNPFLVLLIVAPMLFVTIRMVVRGGPRPLWILRTAIVLLCGILLLRPGLPGGQTQTLATDTDVIVMVDTTASMVAEDWDGDEERMAGVREDVRALVEAYPGARFALLTFDAAAQLRLPLTTDTTALVSAVDVLRPEVTGQSRGSSIGIAASLLEQTLDNAAEAAPDRARMVFYLGDGEQTSSGAPESFRHSAPYISGGGVLGYGTAEGGAMRENLGSFSGEGDYIEYRGERALSVIDENALQAIAGDLGVGYLHRAAGTAPDLPAAPATTTEYREAGVSGAVNDLSWIVAILLAALLCVEVLRAAAGVTRMRGLIIRSEVKR